MKKVYYTPDNPGNNGGVARLRKNVEDETGKKVHIDKVKDFLAEQDAYTLHEPARVHFTRNRFCYRSLNDFRPICATCRP